jgi:hypothetical protein
LDIGVITIGGDLAVNSSVGANAARIEAGISIGKVRIGGTVQGSFGPNSGTISAGGDVEAITIGGDLLGAQGTDSGSIISTNGRIGKLTIGGSVNSGAGLRSGSIRAAEDLGSLKISGDVIGTAAQPVRISAAGQEAPATTDLAIGKMTILGRVEFAQIVAGVGILGNPVNVDAQIGNVKVGGDWIASDLTAGVDAGGDGVFGTPDDELIVEAGGGDPNIKARIGKVVIAGSADGTAGGGDHFGIVAQEVGFLSINGELVFVDEGGLTGSALGTTGDFAFHEIA